MIELGESYVYTIQLKKEIINKKVSQVILNNHPHKFAFFSGDEEKYKSYLIGNSIKDVCQVGGYIELVLDKCSLIFGEGLSIKYLSQGEKAPLKNQFTLYFSDESGFYCTVRMYGVVLLISDEIEPTKYYVTAKQRPSPLNNEFDIEYFKNIIENCNEKISVKALLATEQRIPGLGNGSLQDILLLANIHPKRKLFTLNEEEKKKLFHSIKQVFLEIVKQGGRDIEKDIYGKHGEYKTYLSKKTFKEPCKICSGKINKENYLGGTIYFCEKCQKI